jgi:tRNA G37 N-methylase Trm5
MLAPTAARVSPLLGFGVLGKPRRSGPIETQVSREGLNWCLDLRDDAQRVIFLGLYENELRAAVLSELRPGDTFVDIGANVGFWSLPAASKGARVVAFEPNPAAVRWLRRNLTLNPGLAVDVRPTAVGGRARRA